VRSGFTALAARAVQTGLEVVAVMVLARLLTPEDFGLLAMVLPITLLASSLANLGLHGATLHSENLDHARLNAMFWLSVKLNGAIFGAMALSAPLLAWIYRDSRVTAIALLWAGALYCLSTSGLQEALLKRQMRFGAVLSIQTGSQALGVTVAIVAALFGAGYWSLVMRILSADMARGVANWLVAGWRPARGSPATSEVRRDVRQMLSYGSGWTGYRVVSWLGQQADRVLVGSLAGPAVLGLYHNARRWAFFPTYQLSTALSDVAVSTFSRVREDPDRYRRYWRWGILPALAIPLPIIAYVFVDTHAVVMVLLGSQWLGSVPFLRLMCVAAFFTSIGQLSNWVYLSEGTTNRQFRWALVRTPVMLAGIAIGYRWGAIGIAAGFTAATCLLLYPTLAYCLRTSPLGTRDIVAAAWRPCVASIAAGAILAAAMPVVSSLGGSLVTLTVKLGVFGAAYLAIWAALPGGRRALSEALSTMAGLGRRVEPAEAAEAESRSTGETGGI
jgi:O-antigen/teichoic acid export membrane protein